MEANHHADPLLGHVQQRLANRKQPARATAKQQRGDDGSDRTTSSDDRFRDAAHALNLRDVAAAGWLYFVTASTLKEQIAPDAFQMFRDLMLEEAGNPADPIERMLVEQLALSHFSIGRLRIRACSIDNAKLSVAFSDAATRLLAEFRRCSLALEDYRAKQLARKEKSAVIDVNQEAARAGHTGKPRSSSNGEARSNGKKKAPSAKLTTNLEVPECIRQRMGITGNGALTSTGGTGRNGRG